MYSNLKVVITGGPCSGKSSLINALTKNGFDTVPEQAITVIEQLIQTWGKDAFTKWKALNMSAFQQIIFNTQHKIESQIPHQQFCFLDRGLLDPIAYLTHYQLPIPQKVLSIAKQASYDMVIVCDTLAHFDHRKDTGRTETQAESKQIAHTISQTYLQHGFPVIRLYEDSLEGRLGSILALIKQLSSKSLPFDQIPLARHIIK